MTLSRRRVRAVVRKELREYRRSRSIVAAMAVLPLIFVIQPVVAVLSASSAGSADLSHRHELLYLLAIPALVPATLAAYAIVGERQQGTLEPVLTTPIRRNELILGKALAVLAPAVLISYVVYGLFLVCIALFADPAVASAFIRGSDVIAQAIFTPLIAGWSIWITMAISTRASDVRVAQQLAALTSLPTIAVTTLVAVNVIHASLQLAVIFAAVLLIGNRLGWRLVSMSFDRERLVTGTKV
jgi:ABC-2 type transport system permease protein